MIAVGLGLVVNIMLNARARDKYIAKTENVANHIEAWCNNQIVVVDLLVEKLESLEMTEVRKSDIGEYSGNLRGVWH